jgi:NAD(P)-dependent dehydrogenase (short-subunit alcohol dehydrogenase family)
VSQAVTIIERAIAERGRLDILVNNAGGATPARYLDTTPEALDEAFHFNVSAPFELTKRATPYLLDSGRELRAQIISATPLHRLATVADVASTARWLASPAASYVTGKIIEIDGGAEAPVFPHDTPDLRPANKQ